MNATQQANRMSAANALWEELNKKQATNLVEALNTHHSIFEDGSITADVVWYGGGDSGEFSETNLYKNGKAFTDEALSKIANVLADKYINALHMGCKINEGSSGTITINKDGISDNLEYYSIVSGDEKVCPITDQEVLNILSRIDVASIDDKDKVLEVEHGCLGTDNPSEVSDELIEELSNNISKEFCEFAASGWGDDDGDLETFYYAFRDNKWFYTCCFAELETSAQGKSITWSGE